jgi:hypothetical protein
MTDTDVTFLPNYNNMDLSTDLARLYVTMLTSPPSLPCSRLLARLGVRWPSQSHPVIQRLPVLESLPVQLSQCPWIQNKFTTDITLPSTTTNWILPAHTSRSLPRLLPCLASHFRQGKVASAPPAPHPPIKGLPLPKSFPPILLKSGRSSCCLTSLRAVSNS